MKPAENTRVLRKFTRAAVKGIPRGRRSTHRVEAAMPRPGSRTAQRISQISFPEFEVFVAESLKAAAE